MTQTPSYEFRIRRLAGQKHTESCYRYSMSAKFHPGMSLEFVLLVRASKLLEVVRLVQTLLSNYSNIPSTSSGVLLDVSSLTQNARILSAKLPKSWSLVGLEGQPSYASAI